MKKIFKYVLVFVLGLVLSSLILINNLKITNIEIEGTQKNGLVTISIFDYNFNYYFEK